jgi:putative spermidine/putrescine transport system ATP-binding protein
VLAARADGLAVSAAGDGIPATLGLRTYLGRAYQYRCTTDAGELVANGQLAAPLESGAPAMLMPVAEQCCILPAEG